MPADRSLPAPADGAIRILGALMLGTSEILVRARVMPQVLAEALESAIVFGELAPGERIIEEDIVTTSVGRRCAMRSGGSRRVDWSCAPIIAAHA